MFRVIYNIAKTELQMLFYSPVAWLVLVAFSIQAGILFSGNVEAFVKSQEMGRTVQGVTGGIFASPFGGVFMSVQNYLYMYIPLLTMSLISREIGSKSIQLLYSSPVTNRQIILGKFLSMMIYGLVLIGILLLMVLPSWIFVKDFNLGLVLTGLLGLYLLLCAYAAVGIFMSSLTSYQIVAAIGTFAVLMLLSMVKRWGQEYDIVRDITYWLSISGRSSQFIRGLICSEDVLYFIIVIGFFLSLTIIRLNAIRQKIRFSITLGRNVGVILVVCFLGYITSLPAMKVYYDATTTKMNTLTPNSQKIIADLDGEVTITTYINALEPRASAYASYYFLKPDMERFEQYQRFKPDIKLKYVYYYDTVANTQWERLNDRTLHQKFVEVCRVCEMDTNRFITPEEIRAQIDLSGEGNSFVRQIVRENGDKTWLRIYDDRMQFPSEREISAAFKRMVMELPKVGIVQGYGTRSITSDHEQDFSLFTTNKHFRYALMNQGFDVEAIRLDSPVPEDVDIVVIAGMTWWLSPREEEYLQQYIDRGGNLFVLGEPSHREVMDKMFAKFGFRMTPGILVKLDKTVRSDFIFSSPMKEAGKLSYELDPSRLIPLYQPGVAGLEQIEDKGYQTIPLYATLPTVWNELETTDFERDTVRYNPKIGEVQKVYNTVVALSRQVDGKEQKIILSGDVDCITNGVFGKNFIGHTPPRNDAFVMGGFHWMSNGEVPIDIRRPALPDDKLYLGGGGVSVIKCTYEVILPVIFALLGIVILFRRKGR